MTPTGAADASLDACLTDDDAADRAGGPERSAGAQVVARCDLLGEPRFSDEAGMLFRPYLGAGHAAALPVLAGWMQEAGMSTRLDPAGNLVGRYEGRSPGAPALMIGSHIDSVRDGGRYDGPLGILLGIEAVAGFARRGRRFAFAIEVIAFGDEEGSRFHTSMLCSRAVAGTLGDQSLDLLSNGLPLADYLREFRPSIPHQPLHIDRFRAAARDPGSLLGFVEVHIEQGPQLEAEDLPLGVVTGIAGQLRYRANFTGQAAHAGTAPMTLRRDALAAAAEAILAVERIAVARADHVVATVGRLAVMPGAVNVVPGSAELSIDVRSDRMAERDETARRIKEEIEAIAARRSVTASLTLMQDLVATPCDPDLIDLLSAALREQGLPARRLFSGAGHDTMVMAAIVPTVMLFVRCAGGISHHPAESVRADDTQLALATLMSFLERADARQLDRGSSPSEAAA